MGSAAEKVLDTTQYLTFKLDEEVFALDISQVREVLDYPEITKVPRMPEFMKGVINLRGSVVPVVDMRLKFGMSSTIQTVNTCVIIVEAGVDGEKIVLGALADSVQEVLEMGPSSIEPAPRIGARLKTDFIRGMGKRGDDFIVILEIDRIFSFDEIEAVKSSDI